MRVPAQAEVLSRRKWLRVTRGYQELQGGGASAHTDAGGSVGFFLCRWFLPGLLFLLNMNTFGCRVRGPRTWEGSLLRFLRVGMGLDRVAKDFCWIQWLRITS